MCLCDCKSPVGKTHSIIPNLNSGLVPIDPVGLVMYLVSGKFLPTFNSPCQSQLIDHLFSAPDDSNVPRSDLMSQ